MRLVEVPESLAARALTFRPLTFVGKLSYGIFVPHPRCFLRVTLGEGRGLERKKLPIFARDDSFGGKLALDGATFKPLGARSGVRLQ